MFLFFSLVILMILLRRIKKMETREYECHDETMIHSEKEIV